MNGCALSKDCFSSSGTPSWYQCRFLTLTKATWLIPGTSACQPACNISNIRCKQKCANSFQHLCKYQTAGTYAEQLTQKRLDVHGGKGIVIRNVAKQIYGYCGTVYDQQGSGESMSSNESDSFCRILVRLAWQLAFIDIKPPAECNGSV